MRILPFLFCGLLLGAPALPAAETPTFTWADPADPAVQPVVARGQTVALELVKTLSQEVSAALAAHGSVGAIGTCHLKALPLTTAVATAAAPAVLAVKRTSLKLRNPANAPDPAEQAALDRLAALVAQHQPLPAVLVQRLPASSQPAEWRIYRPLSVAAGCLTCHGDAATFPPALQTALATRYPADAATGYRDQDWRGVIRISLRDDPAATPPSP